MKRPWSHRALHAMYGALLGLGAPAGAIFWRVIWPEKTHMWLRLSDEWQRASYLYSYMTVGTVIAFMLFGWLVGKREDLLSDESHVVKDTFDTLNLLAITDGLTGIYNHRYLQERLSLELESADRYGTPLTSMMMDIDDFKAVNDAFGHPFGDLVLMNIARIIRETIRRVDMVGRYGGEEFLVLMPHTPSETAQPIAERIRKSVQDYLFTIQNKQVKVTLSIGMATYPSKGLKPQDKPAFLAAVDTALYQAKHRGKNQTVIWQPTFASETQSTRIA